MLVNVLLETQTSMPEADAGNLVQASLAGDRRAFAQLIERHERQALATAYAVVGCSATAADVVQEAMLRAWQRLDELEDPARFCPWLGRIVRNLAVDTLRRQPRARLDDVQLAIVPVHDVDTMARDELAQQLNAALAELDEISRQAVTLRYYDNLPSRQIGEIVGLSPAAVDMRLARARGLLREKLSGLLPPQPATVLGAAG